MAHNIIPKSRNDLYKLSDVELLARMIFGEARGCDIKERLWVAYTPFNRLNMNKSYFGTNSIKNVLLKIYNGTDQYQCFDDNPKDKDAYRNFKKILNPNKYEPSRWLESKFIAQSLIEEGFRKDNRGQTTYVTRKRLNQYDKSKKGRPTWITQSIPIKTPSDFKHQYFQEPA